MAALLNAGHGFETGGNVPPAHVFACNHWLVLMNVDIPDSTFSEQEQRWQRELAGKSLVVEAAVPYDDALHGLRSLAWVYTQCFGTKRIRERVLDLRPATLLIGMTAVAGQHYEEGRYWPEFAREAHLTYTQAVNSEFGNAFQEALAKFGLARFYFHRRYLDEILMHAGIPVSGLAALYQLMAERDRKRPGITGTDFVAWLRLKSDDELNAKGIIKPVHRFLTSGRDLAVALLDDLFSVLDAIGGAAASLERAVDELPPPLAKKTWELINEHAFDFNKRTIRRRGAAPEITYAQGQVQVRLPGHSGLSNDPDYWFLEAADYQQERTIFAPFPGDAPHTEFIPISKPCDYVELTRTNGYISSQSWRLEVISGRRKLIAFDDELRFIDNGSELPKGDVWLGFPTINRSSPVTALDIEGEPLDLREIADTALGWSNWVFARFDLSGVRRLRLKSESHLEWIWVASVDQPRLAETPRIPHIRTEDGHPIFQRAPHVILPRDRDVGGKVRTIAIGRVEGEPLPTIEIPSSDMEQTVDPWSELPHPILGEWEIAVRLGGLGRRRTFRVAIAEDCRVTARPTERYFADDGMLETGDVEITFAGQSCDVHLDKGVAQVIHKLQNEDTSLRAVVEIDSMWIRAETQDQPAIISYQPVRVEIEDLPTTVLTLSIPGVYDAAFQLVAADSILQETHEVGNARGIFSVRLDRFSETAQRIGTAELWCNWPEGRHRIAIFRVRRRVKSMALIDGTILIEKTHASLDLDLHLSLDLAPWLPTVLLRLPTGVDQSEMPDSMIGRGPVTVTALEHDPWKFRTSTREVAWNDENQVSFEQRIEIEPTSISDQFLLWTSGADECPDSHDALEFGLQNFNSFSHVRHGAHPELLYRQFGDFTRGFEREFIDAAVHAGWSLASHGRLLAEGLPATLQADHRPVHDITWNVSPYLGLLQSGNQVQDPLLIDKINNELGKTAIAILQRGVDPEAASGKFEQSTLTVLNLKPRAWLNDRRSAFLAEDGRYLDGNRRVARSIQLYSVRKEPTLSLVIDQSDEILFTSIQLLEGFTGGIGREVLLSRESSGGWKNLHAVSLALAFIARLTPRLSGLDRLTYDLYRDCYTDLTMLAPEIVEQDLILAELWLQYWENHEKY